jgi:hypothetical protein
MLGPAFSAKGVGEKGGSREGDAPPGETRSRRPSPRDGVEEHHRVEVRSGEVVERDDADAGEKPLEREKAARRTNREHR